MKPDTKYYVSQLTGVITVMIPSVLGGTLIGGRIATIAGADGSLAAAPIILICAYGIYRSTSALTGFVLEKVGLLPKFAWKHYPEATSWGGYLKRTGAL